MNSLPTHDEAAAAQRPIDSIWGAIASPWFLGAALILITAIAYAPAYQAGFIWDDDLYLGANPTKDSKAGIVTLWFHPSALPQYYPLTYSSLWIEYQFWGMNPLGYHVDNVLLHIACALLLWRVLVRLRVPGAWLAAAIFAVHTIEVQSVAWVTERKNVLSLAMALLALLAWFHFAPPEETNEDRAAREGVRRTLGRALQTRGGWYLLAILLFALAMFAKTAVAAFPAVLLVIDWWKLGRWRTWRVLAALPMFAITIGLGLLTLSIETSDQVGAHGPEYDFSPADRVLIAGRALWFYAGKLAWPYVCHVYPRWDVRANDPLQWIYPVGALALMALLWLLRRRIGRGPLSAVLIFAGVLAPALGFLNIYIMRYSFVADHFQYHAGIALIALAAAAATLAVRNLGAAARLVGAVAATSLLLLLAALTVDQAKVYHSQETLYRHAIARTPQAWLAYSNLAAQLETEGRHQEAIDVAREGVANNPDRDTLHDVLGVALLLSGSRDGYQPCQLDEIIRHFQESLRLNPENADAKQHLAVALVEADRPIEAWPYFESALTQQPDNTSVRFSYAQSLWKADRKAEAGQQFALFAETIAKTNPDSADLHYALGLAAFGVKRLDEARHQLEKALQNAASLSSGSLVLSAYEELGAAALEQNQPAAAAQYLGTAAQLEPQNIAAQNNFSAALLAAGEFALAIEQINKTLQMAPDSAEAQTLMQRAIQQQQQQPRKAP